MGGRPFIGNAQSAVFSPFSAPSYVLPFWKSLAIVALIKLFLAAFGTYLLGRWLGMRFGGALLSGVVFAFGTFFIVWLAWPLTSIFCLIPWLLLCSDMRVSKNIKQQQQRRTASDAWRLSSAMTRCVCKGTRNTQWLGGVRSNGYSAWVSP